MIRRKCGGEWRLVRSIPAGNFMLFQPKLYCCEYTRNIYSAIHQKLCFQSEFQGRLPRSSDDLARHV